MKSWLFQLPPLTSPTTLTPVEQMSPASSWIPRLHTHGNTIWDHASALHVCVSNWAVWNVRRNPSYPYLNVTMFLRFICINKSSYICVSKGECALLVVEEVRRSKWCYGQTDLHLWVYVQQTLGWLCMCVFACSHITPTWTDIPRWDLPVALVVLLSVCVVFYLVLKCLWQPQFNYKRISLPNVSLGFCKLIG